MSTRESPYADVREWNWVYWVGVLLSIAIAAVNLYVGYTEDIRPLFVVGVSFLLGVVLFFSRFWNPVLYLVGLLHISALGVIWVLSGMQFLEWGVVTGVLSAGLGAIALYLFFQEESAVET